MATSRSGRLRKRSSKLTDFESSEDSDARSSPRKQSPDKHLKSTSPKIGRMNDDNDLSDLDDMDLNEGGWDIPEDGNSFLGVKLGEEDFKDDSLSIPNEDDFDFAGEDFDVDDDENNTSKDENASGVAQSLYFSEKHGSKKGTLKDTKKKKTERKDKGQTRFTAYMLWSKEVRPDLIEKHPDLDFSSVNKKLGELWQTVPTSQKYSWRSRAKRYAVRLKQQQGNAMISTGVGGNTKANKTNKTKGNSTSSSKTKKSPSTKTKKVSPTKSTKKNSRTAKSATPTVKQTPPPQNDGLSSPVINPPPSFKVTGFSAIDVASHMKLLGESLNNIGHKLKEHEGQIAVSGSLSVLLDSMLCVLGPLMCLTEQIDEIKGAIPQETHKTVLDNIAYIMPGIV